MMLVFTSFKEIGMKKIQVIVRYDAGIHLSIGMNKKDTVIVRYDLSIYLQTGMHVADLLPETSPLPAEV